MTTGLKKPLAPCSALDWSTQFAAHRAIGKTICLGISVLFFLAASELPAQQKTKSPKQEKKQSKVEKDDKPKSPYSQLINGEFSHAKQPLAEGGLPLWIYGDAKMLKGAKRYPLLIVLHGRRNNVKPGAVFTPQAIATPWVKKENQKKHPCFVVQPYYPPKGGWEKIPDQLDATVAHLMQNLPVDPDKVYLMGFSNGAQGTLQALARNPDFYAAAITVSGPVGIKTVVGKIKSPIRAWVGENDNTMKKNERCIALSKALKASGVDIELVVVKGAGHSCHHVPTRDPKVHQWLFSQTRKNEEAEE